MSHPEENSRPELVDPAGPAQVTAHDPAAEASLLAERIRTEVAHCAYMAEIDNTDACKFSRHRIDELVEQLVALVPPAENTAAEPDGAVWPKLSAPARVGGGRFDAGVSTKLVVEAAIRLDSRHEQDLKRTPEQRREDESSQRKLWEQINGPIEGVSGATPARLRGAHEAFTRWAGEEWGDRPAPHNAWLGYQAGAQAVLAGEVQPDLGATGGQADAPGIVYRVEHPGGKVEYIELFSSLPEHEDVTIASYAAVPSTGSERQDVSTLQAAALQMIRVLDKACEGCTSPLWKGYENGHGEECGTEIDAATLVLRSAVADLHRAP